MNILQKDQLHLVKPKFHRTIMEAWEGGEEVPFEVTLLSDKPPTEAEIAQIKSLAEKYGWDEA